MCKVAVTPEKSWVDIDDSWCNRRCYSGHKTCESLTKATSGTGQARHHGAHRHAGDICDLLVGHPVEFAQNEDSTRIRRQLLQGLSQQSGAVVLEYNFFWIGSARIRGEEVLIKFSGVLQWPVCMQPGIARIKDNLHEPCARVTTSETRQESESA